MFAVTAIAIPPAPAIAIASRDSGNDVETARTIEPRPSAIAPEAIGRGLGRRLNATHRAAIVEPMPDAAIRNP